MRCMSARVFESASAAAHFSRRHFSSSSAILATSREDTAMCSWHSSFVTLLERNELGVTCRASSMELGRRRISVGSGSRATCSLRCASSISHEGSILGVRGETAGVMARPRESLELAEEGDGRLPRGVTRESGRGVYRAGGSGMLERAAG